MAGSTERAKAAERVLRRARASGEERKRLSIVSGSRVVEHVMAAPRVVVEGAGGVSLKRIAAEQHAAAAGT
jgi:hypothetical protein